MPTTSIDAPLRILRRQPNHTMDLTGFYRALAERDLIGFGVNILDFVLSLQRQGFVTYRWDGQRGYVSLTEKPQP